MLATTLGIEFNPELDWDEREQLFKMSGKIVRTSNITQSAIGNKDGLWTTVFAAAVFVNDDNGSAEPARATVNDKALLQAEVLRQSLQGQHDDVGARAGQREDNPRRPDMAIAKIASQTKTNPS
jgi:hypothetical protein